MKHKGSMGEVSNGGVKATVGLNKGFTGPVIRMGGKKHK